MLTTAVHLSAACLMVVLGIELTPNRDDIVCKYLVYRRSTGLVECALNSLGVSDTLCGYWTC